MRFLCKTVKRHQRLLGSKATSLHFCKTETLKHPRTFAEALQSSECTRGRILPLPSVKMHRQHVLATESRTQQLCLEAPLLSNLLQKLCKRRYKKLSQPGDPPHSELP